MIGGVLFAAVAAIAVIVVVAFGGRARSPIQERFTQFADPLSAHPTLDLDPAAADRAALTAAPPGARTMTIRVTTDAIRIVPDAMVDVDPVEIDRLGRPSADVLADLDARLHDLREDGVPADTTVTLVTPSDLQYRDVVDLMDHVTKVFPDVQLGDQPAP